LIIGVIFETKHPILLLQRANLQNYYLRTS